MRSYYKVFSREENV